MKIIDLLNKIANGEEVPKKVRFAGIIFEYDEDDQMYSNDEYKNICDYAFLNDEVEILEEKKKIPEKINKSYDIRILDLDKPHSIKDYDMEQLIEMVQDIYEKQGEICDYLKNKGE